MTPGHVTWGSQDRLLSAPRWYCGQLLCGKATLVSLQRLPHSYTLSEDYGYPNACCLEDEAGRLGLEAKQVSDALLPQGPLDTLVLQREARLTSRESNTHFEPASVDFQRDWRILLVGVAQAAGTMP
jgi:hypothetical protein